MDGKICEKNKVLLLVIAKAASSLMRTRKLSVRPFRIQTYNVPRLLKGDVPTNPGSL